MHSLLKSMTLALVVAIAPLSAGAASAEERKYLREGMTEAEVLRDGKVASVTREVTR